MTVLGVGDDFLPDGLESHVEEEGDEYIDDYEGTNTSSFSAVLSLPVVTNYIATGEEVERSEEVAE